METVNTLREALPRLSPKDQAFAEDLLRAEERWGSLTPRQDTWASKLIARANTPPAEAKPVGDLKGVLALFNRARERLKHPAVVLQVPQLGEVRISVAGERARFPGSLNVTSNGPFDSRTFYGRVKLDGGFEQSNRATVPDALVSHLRRFAEHPAEVAAEHGKLTGACCFCNTPLTDERSTAVGYGPTCAANYGLPWGGRNA